MKQLLWIIYLAAAIAGCSRANRSDETSNAVEGGPPQGVLEISPQALEYGVVSVDQEAHRALTLRNGGQVPVKISMLATSDPFSVVPEVPVEGVLLEAGQARTFDVVFRPHPDGRFHGELWIGSDASDAIVAVTLMGEAAKPLVIVDSTVLDFGQVAMGGRRSLLLTLANDTSITVPVALRFASDTNARGEFSSPDVGPAPVLVGPGKRRAVEVNYAPSHVGTSESILFVTTCPDGCGDTAIALTGEGTADCLILEPGRVDFGTISVGREVSQTVQVRNATEAMVEIADVSFWGDSPPDFHFEGLTRGQPVSVPAGGRFDLNVFYKPVSNGPRQGSILIRPRSSSQCRSPIITLRGTGSTGCLDISPLPIDFGIVATGTTVRRKLFVANGACGSDVWIESIDLIGPAEFSATPILVPVLVPQGDFIEVDMTFSPGAPGMFEGVLRLGARDDQHCPLRQPPPDLAVRGRSSQAFSVGGTVSGLLGHGLVLQNNVREELAVNANGAFVFATPVLSGGAYSVTVETQPGSPDQTCLVTNGFGTASAGDVADVSIVCTECEPSAPAPAPIDATLPSESATCKALGIVACRLDESCWDTWECFDAEGRLVAKPKHSDVGDPAYFPCSQAQVDAWLAAYGVPCWRRVPFSALPPSAVTLVLDAGRAPTQVCSNVDGKAFVFYAACAKHTYTIQHTGCGNQGGTSWNLEVEPATTASLRSAYPFLGCYRYRADKDLNWHIGAYNGNVLNFHAGKASDLSDSGISWQDVLALLNASFTACDTSYYWPDDMERYP